MKRVVFFIQCFPPLMKLGAGVSKRYYKLCEMFIEVFKLDVILITPVDVFSSNSDKIRFWIQKKYLIIKSIPGILISTIDGDGLAINVFNANTVITLITELMEADLCFMDDIGCRNWIHTLCFAMNVPCIITSHTDVTHLRIYKTSRAARFYTWYHTLFFAPVIHATVTKAYAEQAAIEHIWPPLLWSNKFKEPIPRDIVAKTRQAWQSSIENRCDGFLLFCGRWSAEKRIHLLIESVPDNFGLVIVGDSGVDYVDFLYEKSLCKNNVLLLRGMVSADVLATYYAAADLYVSASRFETCGNTLIEAWTCGTPVAVQPAQGHLEWLIPEENGFAINFDNPEEARLELLRAFEDRKKLMKLSSTQDYFKAYDFADGINRNLIKPAQKINGNIYLRIIVGILWVASYLILYPVHLLFWFIIDILFPMFLTKVHLYKEQ